MIRTFAIFHFIKIGDADNKRQKAEKKIAKTLISSKRHRSYLCCWW